MNILISCASDIFSDYLPYSESIISYEITRELVSRGHQVQVFAPRVDVRDPIPQAKIHQIGGYNLFKEGNQGSMERINWWRYSLRSYIKGRRLLEDIDIIHHVLPSYPSHFSLFTGLPRPFVLGPMPLFKHKGVSEEWGPVERQKKPQGKQALLSRGLGRVQNFEAQTSFITWTNTLEKSDRLLLQLDKVRSEIAPRLHAKSVVTYLGVDTRQFSPSRNESSQPTILFAGSISEAKGLRYLLEAMPEVIHRIPNVSLTIVGQGSEQKTFKDLARKLEIEKHVRFEGFVEHIRIAGCFQKCTVFCLPTLREAYGMVLLEAMSCGKPVVATNVGGIPEIVEDGRSGILVRPMNSQELAAALIDILSSDELRLKMGKHNRELCETKFNWRKVVDTIENTYKTLLPE